MAEFRSRNGLQRVDHIHGVVSSGNHARIEESGIGFVGSLPPGEQSAPLAIGKTDYTAVDQDHYPGLSCVDTTAAPSASPGGRR